MRRVASGQAILEMLLSMPVLLVLLVAIFAVGGLFYVGSQTVGGAQSVVINRMAFADEPDAINPDKLQQIMNESGRGSLQLPVTASAVEKVTLTGTDRVFAQLVAEKVFPTGLPFFPSVALRVAQTLDTSLLAANPGGSPWTVDTVFQELAYPDPTNYGVDAAALGDTVIPLPPDCEVQGQLSADTFNAVVTEGTYILTEIGQPASPPAVGAAVEGPTYLPNDYWPWLASVANVACDSDGSEAQWRTECQSEAAALSAEQGVAEASSGGGATDSGTGASDTAATATPAETEATATGDPVATDPAAADPTSTEPAASPSFDIEQCIFKKQMSCRASYANLYMTAVLQLLKQEDQCSMVDTVNDVNFPPVGTAGY